MVFQNFNGYLRIVTTQKRRKSSSFPEFSLNGGWSDIADKEWKFVIKRTQNYLDKITWFPSPTMAPQYFQLIGDMLDWLEADLDMKERRSLS